MDVERLERMNYLVDLVARHKEGDGGAAPHPGADHHAKPFAGFAGAGAYGRCRPRPVPFSAYSVIV